MRTACSTFPSGAYACAHPYPGVDVVGGLRLGAAGGEAAGVAGCARLELCAALLADLALVQIRAGHASGGAAPRRGAAARAACQERQGEREIHVWYELSLADYLHTREAKVLRRERERSLVCVRTLQLSSMDAVSRKAICLHMGSAMHPVVLHPAGEQQQVQAAKAKQREGVQECMFDDLILVILSTY